MQLKSLCVAVLVLSTVAAGLGQSGKKPELLIYTHAGRDYSNVFPVSDVTTESTYRFDNPPIISFHVPKGRGIEALFFDVENRVDYHLSNYGSWKINAGIYVNLISPLIPPDIEIYYQFDIVRRDETNNAGNSGWANATRKHKFTLRRDGDLMEWWFVYYKGTTQSVPRNIWQPIIGALLDAGFDVNVSTGGRVLGMNTVIHITPVVEVTAILDK